MNKLLQRIIDRDSYDPLGEDRELVEKIYTLPKPRDFEKLKLTDEKCVELLAKVEEQVSQADQIRPLPSKIAGLKARVAVNIDTFI